MKIKQELIVLWTTEQISVCLIFKCVSLCVGGLFDVSDRFEETAFRHALERVNEDQNVLPRSRLSAHWERVPSNDSFHASKKRMLSKLSIFHSKIACANNTDNRLNH